MTIRIKGTLVKVIVSLGLLLICIEAQAEGSSIQKINGYKSQFKPLPKVVETPANPLSTEKISLGKKLYFETALSKGKDLSCNSCHLLDKFGVDNQQFSIGHKKQLGGRNSPSVYNSALNFLQFWDGRAKTLEEQALGPILNPVEMAMESPKEVVAAIDTTEYRELFQKSFPNDKNSFTFLNIGNAIAAFERTLQTPGRFDQFLEGDARALSQQEQEGFVTFVETGCTACHNGAGLGGSMFQKLGLVMPYETKDKGLAEVTGKESDNYFFKVPSLRNVEKTAPYFHDGSIQSLETAVRLMAKHQLGRELSDSQVESIVVFLKTLNGKLPTI